MKEVLSLGFWKNKSGHAMSHNKGLDQSQIDFLRSLKVGDRLVLFVNNDDRKPSAFSPDFSIRKTTLTDSNSNGGSEGGL